jgi:hypothetical protein
MARISRRRERKRLDWLSPQISIVSREPARKESGYTKIVPTRHAKAECFAFIDERNKRKDSLASKKQTPFQTT